MSSSPLTKVQMLMQAFCLMFMVILAPAPVLGQSLGNWVEYGPPASPAGRVGHAVVRFGSEVLVLGGYRWGHNGNVYLSDVWSTSDGATWSKLTKAFPYQGRGEFASVVHEGELFVIGGMACDQNQCDWLSDIWSTKDGANWEMVTEMAPFGKMAHAQAVSFQGFIYLTGGYQNGVWRSKDGKTWENLPAPFDSRGYHRMVVHDQAIYLMGGNGWSQSLQQHVDFNDVWRTTEGEKWEQVVTSAAWKGRSAFALAKADQTWVLAGGVPTAPWGQTYNEIWFSNNLIDWKLSSVGDVVEVPGAVYAGDAAQLETGSLLLFGGQPANSGISDTAFIMEPGAESFQPVDNGWWPGRSLGTLASLGDRLLLFGGQTEGDPFVQDTAIWASENGADWGVVAQAPWGNRFVSSSIKFRGRLWMSGGIDFTSVTFDDSETTPSVDFSLAVRSDLWNTIEGETWDLVTASAPYGGRAGHVMIEHQGYLHLIGGFTGKELVSDHWRSLDGKEWELVNGDIQASPRVLGIGFSDGNKMYYAGGFVPEGIVSGLEQEYFTDIWSSADGVNWTLEKEMILPTTGEYAWARVGGRLYILGGSDENLDPTNKIYSSDDLIKWTLEETPDWSPRIGSSVAIFRGALWMAGGDSYDGGRLDDVWKNGLLPLADVPDGEPAIPTVEALPALVVFPIQVPVTFDRPVALQLGAFSIHTNGVNGSVEVSEVVALGRAKNGSSAEFADSYIVTLGGSSTEGSFELGLHAGAVTDQMGQSIGGGSPVTLFSASIGEASSVEDWQSLD